METQIRNLVFSLYQSSQESPPPSISGRGSISHNLGTIKYWCFTSIFNNGIVKVVYYLGKGRSFMQKLLEDIGKFTIHVFEQVGVIAILLPGRCASFRRTNGS